MDLYRCQKTNLVHKKYTITLSLADHLDLRLNPLSRDDVQQVITLTLLIMVMSSQPPTNSLLKVSDRMGYLE